MIEFKDMEELDLKVSLLKGSSISANGVEISPYTLDEIIDFGLSNYMKNMQWISTSMDDFISSTKEENKRTFLEEKKSEMRTFDFFIKLGGEELLDILLKSLGMIFRTDDVKVLDNSVVAVNFEKKGIISYDKDGGIVTDDEMIDYLDEDEIILIHRDNFDEIIEVFKLQNYLSKPSEKSKKKSNPADDSTRELMEQIELNRRKVESKKQSQGEEDDIDIYDIMESVSTKSNSLNKLSIWNLTLYQLHVEFARLEIIDTYNYSIKAMMAGAGKVDISHWSSKMEL